MTQELTATEVASTTSFDTLPFAPFLQETIRTVGYTTPTPIQADAIPVILEGRDLIGLAQTGTGKTAAFVLPLLHKLSGGKKKGVQALILAPTRELAEQINDVIKTFSGRTGIRTVTVYGGVSHRNQISQLRTNVQIVVACPGRLMDHIRGNTIDLSGVDHLILDEADRMLDMGFMPDIKSIMAELPEERQTMLFSATMPEEIAQLTKNYLREPRTVRVKAEQPVALVTHSMLTLKQEEKSERLASWLRGNPNALAVVFTKMKHTAKRLGDRLTKDGVPAVALHGNLSQGQRQKALQGFRDGRFRALIATDIASRGIDVEGVTHVLNYDMPDTLEAYIHRTGRAGRASREGSAVSFVTRGDRFMVRAIEQWIKSPMIRLNSESDSDAADTAGAAAPEGARSADRPRRERRETQGPRGVRQRSERGARDSRGPRRSEGREERREGRGEDRRAEDRRSDDRRGDGRRGERRSDWREGRSDDRRSAGARDARKPRFEGDRQPRRTARPGATGERSTERRSGGFGSRPEREPREGRRPWSDNDRGDQRRGSRSGDRSTSQPWRKDRNEGSAGGQPRGRGPRKPFSGQADIDPRANYVYREREPYFIDRGASDSGDRPRGPRGPRGSQGPSRGGRRGAPSFNRGGKRRDSARSE
jgi:ATP-dependent RNA helicase RhlE